MKATERVKTCEYCGKEFHNPYGFNIGRWVKTRFCSLIDINNYRKEAL